MATSRKPKGGQGRKMKNRKQSRIISDLGDSAAYYSRAAKGRGSPTKAGSADHARIRHSTRTRKIRESYSKGYFREEVHGSGAQRSAAKRGMFDGRRDQASGGRYSTAPYYQSRKPKR